MNCVSIFYKNGGRFPGNYRISFKPVTDRKGAHTIRKIPVLILLLLILLTICGFSISCDNPLSRSPASLPALSLTPLPEDACQIGAFSGDEEQEARFPAYGEEGIQNFEAIIGRKVACIKLYTEIVDEFPFMECMAIYNHGTEESPAYPYIDIHPTDSDFPGEPILQDIIDGVYDEHIYNWAAGVKDYGMPLWICFNGEMNGHWHTGSGAQNGGSTPDGYGDPDKPDGPERCIDAWRHIHNIFTINGTHNAAWVWAVNHEDWPDEEWNFFENYYPGDYYVDWIGVDGYNWNREEYGGWESFSDIFDTALNRIQEINDQKPVIIAEFACAHEPVKKSEWLTDAFNEIKKRKYIKCFIWFNENKEENWLIDSDGDAALKEALSDPYFSSKGDPWDPKQDGDPFIPPPHVQNIRNIALHKVTVASSVQDNSPEFEPANAVDGKMSINSEVKTRWASEHGEETKKEWIYIDLVHQYKITRVVLDWEAAYAKEYSIQVANDDPGNEDSWTDIYPLTIFTAGDGRIDNGGIANITRFKYHNPSRYIRIYCEKKIDFDGQFYGYSLWEVMVCGKTGSFTVN